MYQTELELDNQASVVCRVKDLYFKQAKNDPQKKYVVLKDDNFIQKLKRRMELNRDGNEMRLEFFLYVEKPTEVTNLHRATAARIRVATMKRKAYEVANSVQFGPIEGQHLDVSNARIGGDFQRLQDNTTFQAAALDAARARIIENEVPEDQYVELPCTVRINITNIRHALGLPHHNMMRNGIFNNYVPVQLSNAHLDDIDHA